MRMLAKIRAIAARICRAFRRRQSGTSTGAKQTTEVPITIKSTVQIMTNDAETASASDASHPSSYRNWLAFNCGNPVWAKAEFPIYSDIDFSIASESNLGPYQLRHAFAAEATDPALILFVDYHADLNELRKMERTDTSAFTGAHLADELAALLSLSLGRRFMAGDATRILTIGDDEKWLIMGDRSRPAFFRPPPSGLGARRASRLPRATERTEVDFQQLSTLPQVPANSATPLIRAARLYRDSLWIAESEPDLSWLLLVSALEVAAVQYQAEEPALDTLRSSKPDLVKRLDSVHPDLAAEVAASLSREMRATARFTAFMRDFLPSAPELRPPEDWAWARLSWEAKPMKKAMEKIYRLRSEALHEGIPFPPPMSDPPFVGSRDWAAPSETIPGIASATGGGVWRAEDLPMSLHSFEFVARGALLRWWTKLSTSAP